MNITMSKQTQKMADFFATNMCLLDGLEVGTAKFKNWHDKYVHQYCEEALLHSLTPSGEIKSNPLPKSVKRDVSLTSVLNQYYSGDAGSRKILDNQLSASVNSLVTAFLKIRLDKSRKEQGGRGSDFAYKGHGEKGSMTLDDKLKIENNRYMSYVVSGLMTGWIEQFFQQNVNQYQELIMKALPDLEGKELLKFMSDTNNRAKFTKQFFQLGKDFRQKD